MITSGYVAHTGWYHGYQKKRGRGLRTPDNPRPVSRHGRNDTVLCRSYSLVSVWKTKTVHRLRSNIVSLYMYIKSNIHTCTCIYYLLDVKPPINQLMYLFRLCKNKCIKLVLDLSIIRDFVLIVLLMSYNTDILIGIVAYSCPRHSR